jgi:hypothetical protein
MWTTRIGTRVCLLVGLLLVLTSIGVASAQDQAVTIRWDIISVTAVDGKPTISEGGAAFTSANDGTYIMLTGTGTFDTGMATAPTGGGNWTTLDVTNAMTGNGAYIVTGLVSWSEGPGTLPDALVDSIGDKANFRPGVAVLTVAFTNADGSSAGNGVLLLSCHGPVNSLDGIFEGFVVSMGPVTFYDAVQPVPGSPVGRTSFHVVPS